MSVSCAVKKLGMYRLNPVNILLKPFYLTEKSEIRYKYYEAFNVYRTLPNDKTSSKFYASLYHLFATYVVRDISITELSVLHNVVSFTWSRDTERHFIETLIFSLKKLPI